MLRNLVFFLLPLITPTLIYIGYVALARRRAARLGPDAPPPWFEQTRYVALFGAGVLLAAAALGTWALTTGSSTTVDYQPPRFEDGQVVPSNID
jgi:hypothetical protein